MATIVSQRIIEEGLIPTLSTLSAESNNFMNDGKSFIYYANSSGSSKTITITSQITTIDNPMYGDLTKTNATKTVANGETVLIGPFPVSAYNDSEGLTTFAITSYVEGEDAVAILYI